MKFGLPKLVKDFNDLEEIILEKIEGWFIDHLQRESYVDNGGHLHC